MNRGHHFVVVLAFAACIFTTWASGPREAHAQEVNLSTLEAEQSDRVYARTGAEYGFSAGLGYARTLRMLSRASLASAEVTAPWAGFDGSDFRLRIGVLTPLAKWGGWQIAATVAPTLRRTGNDLGRLTNVGADVGLTGGYYRSHWFLSVEAGFDWAISTHVAHSKGYRDHVFEEARNGWYGAPRGNARYGLQTGVTFSRFDVAFRVGQLRDTRGEAPLLPFYGTLALVTRW